MKVLRLILKNFRCYEKKEISFTKGVNFIAGRNGSGKTTLLEALYLLSTGRSFLTSHLVDLIRKNAPLFYIKAYFLRDGVEQMISMGFDGTKRHIYHNNTLFQHFSPVLGLLPIVLYCPRDHGLIGGTPQERRRFLNVQLGQADPLYVHHLIRYHKAMKQRNALLKIQSEAAIESWEQVMGESAQYLMNKRLERIECLRPKIQTFAKELSRKEDEFDLHYEPSIAFKKIADIQQLLAKQRSKEMIMGSTMLGPHRDDLSITYQRREAKIFASEGQKRTCIVALKMAEWEILKEKVATTPLFAIDDFAIHLDPQRTAILRDKLRSLGQAFVTSPYCPQGEFPINLSNSCNVK